MTSSEIYNERREARERIANDPILRVVHSHGAQVFLFVAHAVLFLASIGLSVGHAMGHVGARNPEIIKPEAITTQAVNPVAVEAVNHAQ